MLKQIEMSGSKEKLDKSLLLAPKLGGLSPSKMSSKEYKGEISTL